MNNRDKQLIDLRPSIPTITEVSATSSAEQFQNKTLRPILKLQHHLLVQIFQQYIIQRKNIYPTLSKEKKIAYIEDSIRKDLKFRSLLVGVVVGHFTLDEWQLYIQNENELRKRLVNMIVERLKAVSYTHLTLPTICSV